MSIGKRNIFELNRIHSGRCTYTAGFAALVIMVVIPAALLLYRNSADSGASNSQSVEGFIQEYFLESEEIHIDVSHLPKGSKINVVGENVVIIGGGAAVVYSSDNQTANVSGTDALEDLHGDTIVIQFRPPFYNLNGVEMMGYANPRMAARLEGDTLHVEYMIDDAYIIFLPIWSIAGQFESYREKGLLPANPLGFSGRGNTNANIFIGVE